MARARSRSTPVGDADDRPNDAVGMRSAATASGVYFGAHALMIGASLISMPILTRLLSKPEYGLVSLMFHQVQVEIHPMPLSKLTTLFQLGTIAAALSSQLVALPHLGYTVLFATTAVLSARS